MAKTLMDVNELLFAQLERLASPELKGEALEAELERAEAMAKLSGQFINSARTTLDALKFKDNAMDADLKLPQALNA